MASPCPRSPRRAALRLALGAAALGVAALSACADPLPGEPLPDGAPGADDPQLPPRSHAALSTWLAAGHYRDWACEDAPHAARPPGAHGMNRICSNAALAETADGPYPIGAAAVKELYRNGAVGGYAVGVKLAAPAAGSSWYWYEAIGGERHRRRSGPRLVQWMPRRRAPRLRVHARAVRHLAVMRKIRWGSRTLRAAPYKGA